MLRGNVPAEFILHRFFCAGDQRRGVLRGDQRAGVGVEGRNAGVLGPAVRRAVALRRRVVGRSRPLHAAPPRRRRLPRRRLRRARLAGARLRRRHRKTAARVRAAATSVADARLRRRPDPLSTEVSRSVIRKFTPPETRRDLTQLDGRVARHVAARRLRTAIRVYLLTLLTRRRRAV